MLKILKRLEQFTSLNVIKTLSTFNNNRFRGDQPLIDNVSSTSKEDDPENRRRDVLSRTKIVSNEKESAEIVKSIMRMGGPVAVDMEVSALL